MIIASIGLALILVAEVGIVGCGRVSNEQTSPVPPISISELSISPSEAMVEIGSSLQFSIVAKNDRGNTVEVTPTWNVTNGIGEISSSGTFTARNQGTGNVSANYNGKIAFATVTVVNVGGISFFSVSNKWISPNGDGVKDSTTISYSITMPATVSLKAYKGEELVGTISETNHEMTGLYDKIWDGTVLVSTESDRDRILDGEYQVKIFVNGEFANRELPVKVDTGGPGLRLSTNYSAFSPNNDGVKDSLDISYSISDNLSPTTDVKIQLWKNGRVLDVLIDEQVSVSPEPTVRNLNWNGKIGDYVMEGNYILELKATDLAGNSTSTTREALVDIQSPRADNIIVARNRLHPANYFSPNGDGINETLSLFFYLSDTYSPRCLMTVKVLTIDTEEVITLLDKEEKIGGDQEILWNGTNSQGNRVQDGPYKFGIVLEDFAGNRVEYDSQRDCPSLWNGIGEVDTIFPTVEVLASLDTFSPNGDGIFDAVDYNITISESAEVYFRIFRQNTTNEIISQWLPECSIARITWVNQQFIFSNVNDGEPFTIGYRDDGVYIYEVFAEDRASNKSNTVTGTTVLDTGAP